MSSPSFGGLLVVAAIALGAPLLVGLVPAIRIPAVVLEIVAGIAVGPAGFGWVQVDVPIQVLSLLGLAFLLFLAGLEIDVAKLRGPVLRSAGLGYGLTLALGLAVGVAFAAAGWVKSPVLIAVALSATSLGLVVPVLKDAGRLVSHPGIRAVRIIGFPPRGPGCSDRTSRFRARTAGCRLCRCAGGWRCTNRSIR